MPKGLILTMRASVEDPRAEDLQGTCNGINLQGGYNGGQIRTPSYVQVCLPLPSLEIEAGMVVIESREKRSSTYFRRLLQQCGRALGSLSIEIHLASSLSQIEKFPAVMD
jgi:hypothetical protein